jgi:RPEL repeat.
VDTIAHRSVTCQLVMLRLVYKLQCSFLTMCRLNVMIRFFVCDVALKTPPAFHEQRQKLERAKMGDLLKAKIQQRPDRQELVRQHILEGECLRNM